ncbi:Helix-turn-helix domain protein [Variovorax sp. PBL-H6]|uniref:helix-turn-helix transcriptional regulator n=1 Tax=Variovorax sp. PBL-H6 TaxID=434009 RepID=UPI0013183EE7|nr:AlpA family phage regulatory protein [Variovorax sp. PBL-H6]VTU29681.1 Helix-turn-helix domain protein [Variovorax sp. PBL-H6]
MNKQAIGYGYMPRAADSIPQFCEGHNISRTHLYELIKQGKGPRLMKLGRRTLISAEAAAEWRARMEAETASNAGQSFWENPLIA